MKPDVTAPGVDVVSSLPTSQPDLGPAERDEHGDAARRRRGRTAPRAPSRLDGRADQVGARPDGRSRSCADGAEVPATREGGGIVDVPRADAPLLFASPTGLSFGQLRPRATATRSITLTDAGGGPAPWTASAVVQQGDASVVTQPQVAAPGVLTVTATAGATTGDAPASWC